MKGKASRSYHEAGYSAPAPLPPEPIPEPIEKYMEPEPKFVEEVIEEPEVLRLYKILHRKGIEPPPHPVDM